MRRNSATRWPQIRPRLPKVKTWIEVSPDGKVAPFAEPFERLAEDGNGGPLDIQRSGDDQFFIYTGGTTGMPKGVIWTHNDLREITLAAARRMGPVPETLERADRATTPSSAPACACCPPRR